MPSKTPRDLSGEELVSLLRRYGYAVTRQRGSHLTLTSNLLGREHRLTVPRHGAVRVGTLHQIMREDAAYLGREADAVAEELFGR